MGREEEVCRRCRFLSTKLVEQRPRNPRALNPTLPHPEPQTSPTLNNSRRVPVTFGLSEAVARLNENSALLAAIILRGNLGSRDQANSKSPVTINAYTSPLQA